MIIKLLHKLFLFLGGIITLIYIFFIIAIFQELIDIFNRLDTTWLPVEIFLLIIIWIIPFIVGGIISILWIGEMYKIFGEKNKKENKL